MPRDDVDEEMGGDSASDELEDELVGVSAVFDAVPALLLRS